VNAPAHIASAEAAEAALAAEGKRAARIRRMAPAYRQLYGFVITLALVIGILALWAWAQNQEESYPDGRLWGELAFLVLVLWWGITILSSLLARITRAIHATLEVPAISIGQAFVWAVITAVAVPVAIQLAIQDVLLGLVPLVAATACSAGIWYARRGAKRVPRQPLCVSAVVGALTLVPLAAWASDRPNELSMADPTGRVPGAELIAYEVRPLLFFDEKEKFQPVKIERAKAYACNYDLRDPCDPHRVNWSNPPKADYLQVRAAPLDLGEKPGGPTSAIYYHVFRRNKNTRKEKLYVDYWWYFAHNPAPVGRSFFCGKALTRGMLGPGCAEHPADWEGVTVVLVPSKCNAALPSNGCVVLQGRKIQPGRKNLPRRMTLRGQKTYRISKVHYAQHDRVVSYEWNHLQNRWRGTPEHAGARNHPLVFVALDSHASYAAKCPHGPQDECRQLVRPSYQERRNGQSGWTNNRACRRTGCLLPLTNANGRPWKWNAFDGRWGPHHCILLDSYCDTQRAPKSPAFQPRYRDPCLQSLCLPGPVLERAAGKWTAGLL
jgi:hypothetical protein